MRKIWLMLLLPVILAACAAEPTWAPEEDVQKAIYRAEGPTTLTLYTVLSVANGSGAHSGLLINGSQRVMFDPAGTWYNPAAPERNDLHYGITPAILDLYEDYHARETFDVIVQTVEVSPEAAEIAIRAAQEYGAVPKARCTYALTGVLKQVPGFEDFPRTFFPKAAMKAFAKLPGVTTVLITDTDGDDNKELLREQVAALPS